MSTIARLMRPVTPALWVALASNSLYHGHHVALATATLTVTVIVWLQTAGLVRTVRLQREALDLVRAAVDGQHLGAPAPPPARRRQGPIL